MDKLDDEIQPSIAKNPNKNENSANDEDINQEEQDNFNRNIHILLELYSQNKLNTLNPWDSSYISQLDRFILAKKATLGRFTSDHLDVDFGEKAAIIDASSTIYAYKVQSLYDSMNRVVEALSYDPSHKKSKTEESETTTGGADSNENTKRQKTVPPSRTVEPEELHTQAPESTSPYDIIFFEATKSLKNNTGIRTLLCFNTRLLPTCVNMICDQDSDYYGLLGLLTTSMDTIKHGIQSIEISHGDLDDKEHFIDNYTNTALKYIPNRLRDDTPEDVREYYLEQVDSFCKLAQKYQEKVMRLRNRLDVMLDSRFTIDAMIDISTDLPRHVVEQKKEIFNYLHELRLHMYRQNHNIFDTNALNDSHIDPKQLQNIILPSNLITIPQINIIFDNHLEWFLHDVDGKQKLYSHSVFSSQMNKNNDQNNNNNNNNNNNDDDDDIYTKDDENDNLILPIQVGGTSASDSLSFPGVRRVKALNPALLEANAEETLQVILQHDANDNNNLTRQQKLRIHNQKQRNHHLKLSQKLSQYSAIEIDDSDEDDDNDDDDDAYKGLTMKQRRELERKKQKEKLNKHKKNKEIFDMSTSSKSGNTLYFHTNDLLHNLSCNMNQLENNNNVNNNIANKPTATNQVRTAILNKLLHTNPLVAKEIGIFQQQRLPLDLYAKALQSEGISNQSVCVIPNLYQNYDIDDDSKLITSRNDSDISEDENNDNSDAIALDKKVKNISRSLPNIMKPPASNHEADVGEYGIATTQLSNRCRLGYILPSVALAQMSKKNDSVISPDLIAARNSPTKRYHVDINKKIQKNASHHLNMFDFGLLSHGKLVSVYDTGTSSAPDNNIITNQYNIDNEEEHFSYFLSHRDRKEQYRRSLAANVETDNDKLHDQSADAFVQLDDYSITADKNNNTNDSLEPNEIAFDDYGYDDYGGGGGGDDDDDFYNDGDLSAMFGSQIPSSTNNSYNKSNNNFNINDNNDSLIDDINAEQLQILQQNFAPLPTTDIHVNIDESTSNVVNAYNIALSMMSLPTTFGIEEGTLNRKHSHQSVQGEMSDSDENTDDDDDDDDDNNNDEDDENTDDNDEDDDNDNENDDNDNDDNDNSKNYQKTKKILKQANNSSRISKKANITIVKPLPPPPKKIRRPKTLLEAALQVKKQNNHRVFQTLLRHQNEQQSVIKKRKKREDKNNKLFSDTDDDDDDNHSTTTTTAVATTKKKTSGANAKAKIVNINFDELLNASAPPPTAGVLWNLSQGVIPQSQVLKTAMKTAHIKTINEGLQQSSTILPPHIVLRTTDMLSDRTYLETRRAVESAPRQNKKNVTFVQQLGNYHNTTGLHEQVCLHRLLVDIEQHNISHGRTLVGNVFTTTNDGQIVSQEQNNITSKTISALTSYHQTVGQQLFSYHTRANTSIPPRLPVLSYETSVQLAETTLAAGGGDSHLVVNLLLSRVVWNSSLRNIQQQNIIRRLRLSKEKRQKKQMEHFSSVLRKLDHGNNDIISDTMENNDDNNSDNYFSSKGLSSSADHSNAVANALLHDNNNNNNYENNDGYDDDFDDIGGGGIDDDDFDTNDIDGEQSLQNGGNDASMDFQAMGNILEEQNKLMLAKQQESDLFLSNLRATANNMLNIDDTLSQQQQQQQQYQQQNIFDDPFGLKLNNSFEHDSTTSFSSDNPFHLGLYDQTKEDSLQHSTISKYFNIRQLKRSLLTKLVKMKLPTVIITNLRAYAQKKGLSLKFKQPLSISTRKLHHQEISSLSLPERPFEALEIQYQVEQQAPDLLRPALLDENNMGDDNVNEINNNQQIKVQSHSAQPGCQIQSLRGGISGQCYYTTFKKIVTDIQYEYNDFDSRSVSSFFLALLILSNETNLELRPRPVSKAAVLKEVLNDTTTTTTTTTSNGNTTNDDSNVNKYDNNEPFSLGYDLCNFDIFAPLNAGHTSTQNKQHYQIYGESTALIDPNKEEEINKQDFTPSETVVHVVPSKKKQTNRGKKKASSQMNDDNASDDDDDNNNNVRKNKNTKRLIKTKTKNVVSKKKNHRYDDEDIDDDFIATSEEESISEQLSASSSSSESEELSGDDTEVLESDDETSNKNKSQKYVTPKKNLHRRHSIPVRRGSDQNVTGSTNSSQNNDPSSTPARDMFTSKRQHSVIIASDEEE